MKRLYTIAILAIAVFAAGCTEDFEYAKFRCKINGEDFIPQKDLIDFSYTENQGDDRIRIRGTAVGTGILSDKPYGEFEIEFSFDETNPGTVELGYDVVYYGNNEWDKTFRSSADDPGTLTITSLDLNAKRVTANFELTLYADGGETLTVTEGFFDQDW
jgi:hypothetical protein